MIISQKVPESSLRWKPGTSRFRPESRESVIMRKTGFRLEFIPMKIGAGMTEKIFSDFLRIHQTIIEIFPTFFVPAILSLALKVSQP